MAQQNSQYDADNEEQDDNRPLTPDEQRARLRKLIILAKSAATLPMPKLTTPCQTICLMQNKLTVSSI